MASYQPVTQEFLAQLESIVPGRVTAGSEVNPDYGRDEMPIYGVHPPEAAVEILSTEEAAAVVKLCYAHNIPVTTRGAGTGLVGGCVPVFGGVKPHQNSKSRWRRFGAQPIAPQFGFHFLASS